MKSFLLSFFIFSSIILNAQENEFGELDSLFAELKIEMNEINQKLDSLWTNSEALDQLKEELKESRILFDEKIAPLLSDDSLGAIFEDLKNTIDSLRIDGKKEKSEEKKLKTVKASSIKNSFHSEPLKKNINRRKIIIARRKG